MPSYEHEKLIERILKLDQPPDDDTTYARWITADRHLDLLRKNAEEDEVIVYACDKYTFIHAVVISEDVIDLLDNDLFRWSGGPFFAHAAAYTWGGGRDDVWIERGPAIDGSKMIQTARQLVFGREIMGLPGKGDAYFEVSQEYSHLSDIHHRPEHSAYCRIDEHGDLEYVVTITKKTSRKDVSLVTFKREPLEEYLAASRSVLVRMFDFQLLRYGEFDAWPNTPENIVTHDPIFYRQKIDAGKASYTRGIQILRPSRPSAEIFSRMKREPIEHETAQYVDFVAHDWRNGGVSAISTDPCATTNYFQADGNSLPFELSPAFFKPEVLSRYKNDTDKYLIEDRRIHCRSAWELRGYDVNEAGQVHAYICDLRNLPYSEQLYWKSFNEEPKTGISERALTNDFKDEPVEITDPLARIKHILTQWEQSSAPWWTLRDPASAGRVTSPLTSSRDEWARAFTNLAQLVIEGFETKAVRTRLDEMGIAWQRDEKSILLLERVLSGEAADGCAQSLDGLRSVQRIRSKVGAHARGTEADSLATRAVQEHGSYAAHFEDVCRDVATELEYIERAFSQGIAEDQKESALIKPLSAQIDEATK